MAEIINQTNPKANKRHRCDGRWQIKRCAEDIEEAQLGRCSGINKGDYYITQTIKDDNGIYTWKSCQKCYDIIEKYKLYDHE